QVALDRDKNSRQMHDELLRQAITNAKPRLFVPKFELESPDRKTPLGNPTDYVILLAPIIVEEQATGLVEVWHDPNRGADSQRGFLQFMVRMATLASDYLRKANVNH